MNVDQFIAANLPARFQVSDLECFHNFGLDMTQSFYKRWNDAGRVERIPVMERVAGQKTSERMLWNIEPVDPVKIEPAIAAERAANVNQLAALYAITQDVVPESGFELEVDPFTFATGLAHAYRHHTGEMPTFLLDDDGSL